MGSRAAKVATIATAIETETETAIETKPAKKAKAELKVAIAKVATTVAGKVARNAKAGRVAAVHAVAQQNRSAHGAQPRSHRQAWLGSQIRRRTPDQLILK